MKKYILAAFVLTMIFSSNASAQCTKIVGVSPNIYKQSAPLRNSRGVLIGYRLEPTWIDVQGVLSRGSINVYSTNNVLLGKCPWASAHGFRGRARCSFKTATLRRKAIAASGSPSVRFQLKNGVCSQVPDAGKCVGSVKGPCNRLIK